MLVKQVLDFLFVNLKNKSDRYWNHVRLQTETGEGKQLCLPVNSWTYVCVTFQAEITLISI